MTMVWQRGKFTLIAIIFQVIFIVLFAIFVEYDHNMDAKYDRSAYSKEYLESHKDELKDDYDKADLNNYYPFFQDVHVMIFVGFGFLMTFMRKYSLSSLGFNFLIGAFIIQWATLMSGFLHLHDGKIQLSATTLLTSDFACATVMITFGAVLGKVSPTQLIVLSTCEIFFFSINEWAGLTYLKVADVGGSMFVHVFGAYFGLAVTGVLYYKNEVDAVSSKMLPSYNSNLFSMIGAVFLWMFWPSFNAALASGDDRQRAVMNTYLSLAACCVMTFTVSFIVSKEEKIDMAHIQNATLAGGVAVGTVADMQIEPWGALTIGAAAAIVSVLGFRFLTPFLGDKLRINDSCGVNNLHGMPGLMAGVAGAIMASMVSTDKYGPSVYQLFPAMVPPKNTTEYTEFSRMYNLPPGDGRSASKQGGFQLAALVMCIAVSVAGGVITGLVLRIPIWNRPQKEVLFEDEPYWEIPYGNPPESGDINQNSPAHKEGENNTSYVVDDNRRDSYTLQQVDPNRRESTLEFIPEMGC